MRVQFGHSLHDIQTAKFLNNIIPSINTKSCLIQLLKILLYIKGCTHFLLKHSAHVCLRTVVKEAWNVLMMAVHMRDSQMHFLKWGVDCISLSPLLHHNYSLSLCTLLHWAATFQTLQPSLLTSRETIILNQELSAPPPTLPNGCGWDGGQGNHWAMNICTHLLHQCEITNREINEQCPNEGSTVMPNGPVSFYLFS